MLFAKFVPGFASVSTALAGAMGLRYWKFVLFDLLGALLWVGLAVALGYLFRDAVAEMLETLASLGKWGLLLIAAALAAWIAAKWWKRFLFIRQLRMDRVTVDELKAMLDAQEVGMILDVRSALTQATSGRIPARVRSRWRVLPKAWRECRSTARSSSIARARTRRAR